MAQFSSAKIIENLKQLLGAQVKINDDKDGLELVFGGSSSSGNSQVVLPGRLLQWLLDLRLLRHIPLAYLVPDPAMLPPESIRFFHVDRTWADRVVDGCLSAGDIGTVDMTFTVATLSMIRGLLDAQLGVADGPMTGMLIRSELVERWPDLIVRPLPADKVSVIRQETLSKSIMIVLFAGLPHQVQIREPDVGLRFGIEHNEETGKDEVNECNAAGVLQEKTVNGKQVAKMVQVQLLSERLINIAKLKTDIPYAAVSGDPNRARDVALMLRQLPYVAVFKQSVDEKHGSELHDGTTTLGKAGKTLMRQVNVASVFSRRASQGVK